MRWLPSIAGLALALLVGRWIIFDFVGTALVAYGETEESRHAAISFAPAKAEVLAARGRYLLYRAGPVRVDEAISDLQRAVRASPRDYRFWLELGRAYESNGELPRAELSLRRATELAPRHFEPRWVLANFRLRAGQTEQAFADFKAAILLSGGSSLKPNRDVVFNVYGALAHAVGKDPEVLRRVTPDDSVSQSYLVAYLADHLSLDAALDLWQRLPDEDPDSYRSLCFQLLKLAQGAGRFQEEREVWRRFVALEGETGAESEGDGNLITNPGFERAPLSERYIWLAAPPLGFDWVLRPHAEVRARRSNSQSHRGAYALHLTFATPMRSEFQEITQLIAVEPSHAYRLSYFVKTERMPSTAPYVELTDAAQPGLFALRSTIPSGTTDWCEMRLEFTLPPSTRGLRLVIRSPQLLELSTTHPGELWLDDFRLERTDFLTTR